MYSMGELEKGDGGGRGKVMDATYILTGFARTYVQKTGHIFHNKNYRSLWLEQSFTQLT